MKIQLEIQRSDFEREELCIDLLRFAKSERANGKSALPLKNGHQSDLSGPKTGCRASVLGQALERALAQQSLGGNVAVLDLSGERRLNPCRLDFSVRFGELRLRADHGIELLPDFAGESARPARADLAHIDQV